ncbi:MAG: radical SAM protein, partial [Promethearchaeota archaeon]
MVTTLKQHANGIRPKGLVDRVFDGLDTNMTRLFMPWVARHPRYLRAGLRLARSYKKTEKLRQEALKSGLRVPPFLILSITSQCNLSCVGCYAAAVGTLESRRPTDCSQTRPVLNYNQWRDIIADASELGVFSFIIAGGEPFLFRGLVQLCEEFDDRFFIILTNGTALAVSDYARLKKTKNIAVIVSVEGSEELTDSRRGKGVHKQALETLGKLKSIGVPSGISVTITRKNYQYWMTPENLDRYVDLGVLVGVFIEYIPLMHENLTGTGHGSIDEKSELMLTAVERDEFRSKVLEYRRE